MAREPVAAANQPEVRWDPKDAVSHTCDVANSTAGPDDVVLNFGATQRSADAPDQVTVCLARRFTMVPMTARALRDMLRDIIAMIDADRQRGP